MVDLVCVICKDLYDDPVLARDGFCYCRACIWAWVGTSPCWTSPRSNERYEGGPVLRGDVERACLALEARLAELRGKSGREALKGVLEMRWNGRPAAPASECCRLLREVPQLSPHEELELAHRAGKLQGLASSRLAWLCSLDRRCTRVPLLQMSVVVALLHEAARRCRSGGDRDVLVCVRAHFLWRSQFSDAVEIPGHRVVRQELAGVYLRSWDQLDDRCIVFEKTTPPEARLTVPLRSNRQRGTVEDTLYTRLHCGDAACHCFASEAANSLPTPAEVWAARRGRLPFPDSRGGETDDEDEETEALECAASMQRALLHLPSDFGYLPHVLTGDRTGAALREKSAADDALIEALLRARKSRKRPRTAGSEQC